jgi:hypothetical protein
MNVTNYVRTERNMLQNLPQCGETGSSSQG